MAQNRKYFGFELVLPIPITTSSSTSGKFLESRPTAQWGDLGKNTKIDIGTQTKQYIFWKIYSQTNMNQKYFFQNFNVINNF